MRQILLKMIHKKCRNSMYPSSNISRFEVPDDKISWDVDFPEYNPPFYSSKALENKPWADPDVGDPSFSPKWNSLDHNGNVNRISFVSTYKISKQGCPLNPLGRTGIQGRGILGRWGPNHAADPIVTRWKRNADNTVKIHEKSKKPILQFVSIQRRDTNEWAIPGGMVDPGEKVSVTLRREFMEEALNALEKSDSEIKEIKKKLEDFFDKGQEIYKGYVDDPRNTDNAWMETVAYNFHDENDEAVGNVSLQAGDDAKNVRWTDLDGNLDLYASHKDLVTKVMEKFNAHW